MRFFVPTELIIGENCVTEAAEKLRAFGDCCLIVTGKTAARKSGALADLQTALQKGNVRYTVYDGIRQNPTVASCIKAGAFARECGARFIIGVGGGSPLDAAKAVAVFAANAALTEAELYACQWTDVLPVVCIGTTAGTGSEVTPVSVLTDTNGVKSSIRSDRLYPALSLGDPQYLTSLPDSFLRSCAADAAAHCIESFFGKSASDISRLFAAHGASILAPLFHKIRKSGAEALTADDRAALYTASIYGGYAISVTGTAFPHAMGYFLSERHGVAHGTACAVFLPSFLQYANDCDPALAGEFFVRTGCGLEAWCALLQAVAPSCEAHVSAQEIESMRTRFTGNGGLARSPGNFDCADALQLLTKLFS